jgi:hypothetical protein
VWGSLGSVTLALLQPCTSTTLLHSLDMQQYWTALASLAVNNVNKQHCYTRNNRQAFPRSQDCCFRTSTDISCVFFGNRSSTDVCVCLAADSFWLEDWVHIGKKREEHMSLFRGRWRHSIVGAGKWQVNDGLYAEVPLWCASGGPTFVWRLSDCKNGSECWKIATRGPVGRIL